VVGWVRSRRELRTLLVAPAAALLIVLVVGMLLDAGYVNQQGTRTLRAASARAALLTQLVLAPRLSGATTLAEDTPDHVQAELAATFAEPAVKAATIRITLWDPTGRVMASDDSAFVGRSFPVDGPLRDALDGVTEAHVATTRAPEDDADQGLPRSVEVYLPARVGGTIEGAFELYIPDAPLAAVTGHDRAVLERDLALALAALLAALGAVTWPVIRRLRRQAQAAASASLTDPLTGLANRLGLEAEMTRLVEAGEPFVLAVADVQGLGEVNEALGYDGGDALLSRIAGVLTDPGGGRLAARIGGGEFGVLLPGADPDVALPRLRATAAQEQEVAGVPVTPLLSIGAARHPEHSTSVRQLLAMATAAQVAASRRPDGIALYDPVLDPYDAGNLRLLTELRRAVAGGQLVLHYQPQVDVAGGRIVGVEALVRWEHPRRGLLLPADFLPIAEKTGLVVDITRWVLRAAAEQAAAWRAQGAAVVVSVNISARDLADRAFGAEAELITGAAGGRPAWICLELTETALVDDRAGAVDVLQSLAGAGFRLSLDDFGQGYTSLGQLRDLPLHEIKLDRAFVDGMDRHAADAAIVSGVAGLAHNLGLTLVAEGVETAAQLELVTRAGYDVVQGWFLGRPGPADVLTPRLLMPRQPGERLVVSADPGGAERAAGAGPAAG
jgi:diguanylate cyclase (GGDEF)-like protein